MLSNWISKITDAVSEQAWFQELKSKWDQVDPTYQTYIRIGSIAAVILAVVGFTFEMGYSTYALKKGMQEKRELQKLLVQAQDELKSNGGNAKPDPATANGTKPTGVVWKKEIENVASSQTIAPADLEWVSETPAPSGKNAAIQEFWIAFKVKPVDLRQLVRFAVSLESHEPPMKIRNLAIDSQTKQRKVEASISVSGFQMRP